MNFGGIVRLEQARREVLFESTKNQIHEPIKCSNCGLILKECKCMNELRIKMSGLEELTIDQAESWLDQAKDLHSLRVNKGKSKNSRSYFIQKLKTQIIRIK